MKGVSAMSQRGQLIRLRRGGKENVAAMRGGGECGGSLRCAGDASRPDWLLPQVVSHLKTYQQVANARLRRAGPSFPRRCSVIIHPSVEARDRARRSGGDRSWGQLSGPARIVRTTGDHEKRAICWAFPKPSDGLEPSTPSLPSNAGPLPWAAEGCGLACLSRFRD